MKYKNCYQGGIKAVVWTDVFQMIIMLFGLVVVVTLGCVRMGGVVQVLAIADLGDRLNVYKYENKRTILCNILHIVLLPYFSADIRCRICV